MGGMNYGSVKFFSPGVESSPLTHSSLSLHRRTLIYSCLFSFCLNTVFTLPVSAHIIYLFFCLRFVTEFQNQILGTSLAQIHAVPPREGLTHFCHLLGLS